VKKTEEVEIESITKIIDPSSEQIDSDDQQKKGLGFFSYIILPSLGISSSFTENFLEQLSHCIII